MPFIEIRPQVEAEGLARQVFDAAVAREGKVFEILRIQSPNPAVLEASIELYLRIMHGESPLTRAERELIAVVVSATNGCHY